MNKFWEQKGLSQMSTAEWEALCDGCGKCCLKKTSTGYDNSIQWTDVACRLLDHNTCRCAKYDERRKIVPECGYLTPEIVETNAAQLPRTCAYRLVARGMPLPEWHYLISGDRNTIHLSGLSVRLRVVSETEWPDDSLGQRCVDWPTEEGIIGDDDS